MLNLHALVDRNSAVREGRGGSGRKGVLLPPSLQSKDISFLSINRACNLTIQRLGPMSSPT